MRVRRAAASAQVPLLRSAHLGQRRPCPVPPCSSADRLSTSYRLCRASLRRYATTSSKQNSYAVLGAGITGLSTAKYLRDAYPDAQITIFEESENTGGWIRSHKVETGDGEIIFETGTRSLRPNVPNGTLALRLIEAVGLSDELLVTSRNEPSARNRFIYYPDRLVRLPGPGAGLLQNLRNAYSSGLFAGLPQAIGQLDLQAMPASVEDESVGEYLSKRLGERMANNVASAVFHGIYAGDIWKLSAKSILSWLFEQESRQDSLMGVFRNLRRRQAWSFADDVFMQMLLQEGAWSDSIATQFRNASVFTFPKGVQQLPDALVRWLQDHDVSIQMNHKVEQLSQISSSRADKMEVKVRRDTESLTMGFDHVVSTIPSPSLHSTLESRTVEQYTGLNKLQKTKAVDVAVVNFYFRTSYLLHKTQLPKQPLHYGPLEGFGYLIPNSVPLAQNPERALGVIFESDVSPDLWTSVPVEKVGTRLTVMMGGHWWDGWSELPPEAECEEMARSVLLRHLGIDETPAASMATIQRQCIPQYTVGHSKRMANLHKSMRDAYGGKLSVAGSWYSGVGVNDCLRSAFETVNALRTRPAATGLEKFAEGRPMVLVRRAQPGVTEVVHMEEGARSIDYSQWKKGT